MMTPAEFVKHFVTDESGQVPIEHSLVAAPIGLVSGVSPATPIGTVFTSIGTTLTTNV
jgi:Flp pilus assembly pilin Flp